MKKKLIAVAAVAAVAFVVRTPAVHAYREWKRTMKVKALLAAPPNSFEALSIERDPDGEILADGVERDDPRLRTLARRAWSGEATDEVRAQWARIASAEATKWADLMPGAKRGRAAFSAESWVSLGPEDADSEWNGTSYSGKGYLNSGLLSDGQSFALTIDAPPGTYEYVCLVHDFMKGKIIVAPSLPVRASLTASAMFLTPSIVPPPIWLPR